MPGISRAIKNAAKLKKILKLKFLRGAAKKEVVSGELMQINRGMTKVESKAIQNGGLMKIPSKALVSPKNAGAVSGALTSRIALNAEKKMLATGERKFPKWLKDARHAEEAIIENRSKGSRMWNITKRVGKVGLGLAAWSVAGYYFDKALDYILGGGEDGPDDPNKPDKGGITPKDAFDAGMALSDEVHGLEDGYPIGMVRNFDLSRDPEFMQIYGDFEESLLRGKLADQDFAGIRAMEGYSSSRVALLIHRATEAIKALADLTGNASTLKLMAIQSLASDDTTYVQPMGYQILDDVYMHDDSVELAADGHLSNITNFIDEYRNDVTKAAFDDMTKALQITESAADFIDALADPTKAASKLAVYLLASYSNDKFEDTMGMLQSFLVDSDADDDESAMLNFITSVKQRSTGAIAIINKTL